MMKEPDICPKCGQRAMPNWDSLSTARCCQNCGHVEERELVEAQRK